MFTSDKLCVKYVVKCCESISEYVISFRKIWLTVKDCIYWIFHMFLLLNGTTVLSWRAIMCFLFPVKAFKVNNINKKNATICVLSIKFPRLVFMWTPVVPGCFLPSNTHLQWAEAVHISRMRWGGARVKGQRWLKRKQMESSLLIGWWFYNKSVTVMGNVEKIALLFQPPGFSILALLPSSLCSPFPLYLIDDFNT